MPITAVRWSAFQRDVFLFSSSDRTVKLQHKEMQNPLAEFNFGVVSSDTSPPWQAPPRCGKVCSSQTQTLSLFHCLCCTHNCESGSGRRGLDPVFLDGLRRPHSERHGE